MSDSNDPFNQRGPVSNTGVIQLERPRPASEPPPEPDAPEDAGTQALSEALRSSFAIIKVIMVILVVIFFGSGIFTVPSGMKAIVLTFGKPVGAGEKMLLEPGLHFAWPYPIDERVFIPTSQQTVRSTVGWFAVTPEQEVAKELLPPASPSLNPAVDGYAITADANVIHVRATVNYRITAPIQYALSFVNASTMVQNAVDSAIVFASARTKVDDALRLNRDAFREKVLDRVRELIDQLQLGITLDPSTIEIVPPRYLNDKFESVNAADSDSRQTINKARTDATNLLSAAWGEVASVTNRAKVEANREIQTVQAEARYFLEQLPYYTKNPALFASQLQVATLHRVLTNAQDKEFNGTGRAIRTQLSREAQKPAQQQGQP